MTPKIEQEYPELYQYTDENPMRIPSCEPLNLNTQKYSEYTNNLNLSLEHLSKNFQKFKYQ